MYPNISRFDIGFLFVAFAVGSGGCELRHHYDVSGNVKYNGARLRKPDGQIVFVGTDGEQVTAAIDLDGNYWATNVSSGQNAVAVYYPNPRAQKAQPVRSKHGRTLPPAESPFLTPYVYGVAETSQLRVTVEKETVFDVNLTGPVIR